ncbi:MAG: hypothetical protein SGJ27_15265 [Candidatus Melainabacteria bacterium]|nr:hypothetical protein [Candidatus Melainabacteria bacterium]
MKRLNITGLVLLITGIAIGIALTMMSMHVVGVKSAHATHPADGAPKLIAEKSPPGAADAQTRQAQTAADPAAAGQPAAEAGAPKPPADWIKPHDLATQNGAAPSAVPSAPKYQSSHTEYVIYNTGHEGMATGAPPVHMMAPGAAPIAPMAPMGGYHTSASGQWIGENGMLQNPCADPPSVRRRPVYRH